MRIKQIEQAEDGTYHFQGSLTPEEIQFLLEMGMAVLFGQEEYEADDDLDSQLEFDFEGPLL